MVALATDNFNRANDATGLGANWTTASSPNKWTVSSNQAVPSAFSGGDSVSYYSAIAWPNDHYSKAQLTANGTSTDAGPGLLVRKASTSSEDTFYWTTANHAATNNVDMYKVVSTTFTLIQRATQAYTDGDTFEMDAQGTTLRAIYVTGSSTAISTTDSAIGSGNAGLAYSSTITSAAADNWEGGDFTVAGVVARLEEPMQNTQGLVVLTAVGRAANS